jgi:methyl-accepting chemotaxis protein
MIDQRLTSLFLEVNNFPRDIGDEIIFLSKLSSLKSVINNQAEPEDYEIKNLEEDFLVFSQGVSTYYQIRYINENGEEITRVDSDGINSKIIPKEELQNKKARYYFTETMNLHEGEIFISRIDLNIEHGEIENRGTEEEPIYVPVMRYATPVFNDQGTNKGIVIFNTYANYFLGDIRMAQREGEKIFLINKDGHYLAHPDSEKELSFMFDDKDHTFFEDYPEIPKEVLLDSRKKTFESEELIFSFRRIHPSVSTFGLSAGSKKVFGENSGEAPSWIMISVSAKDYLNVDAQSQKKDYLYFLLFSGLIILIIVVLVFFLVFKSPEFLGGKK